MKYIKHERSRFTIYFQTPRRQLKIRCAAKLFDKLWGQTLWFLLKLDIQIRIWRYSSLRREENCRIQRKTPLSKTRTNNEFNPHAVPGWNRCEPGHRLVGGANALTTKLYLLTLGAIVDVLSGKLACYIFFLQKTGDNKEYQR